MNDDEDVSVRFEAIERACNSLLLLELQNNNESCPIDTLLSNAESNLNKLTKMPHFQLLYTSNQNAKQFTLNCLWLLIRKTLNAQAKLCLLQTAQKLMELEIQLETVRFRHSSVRASYQSFFHSLFAHIFDLVRHNQEALINCPLPKIKSFIRILSYLLYCVPFDNTVSQCLPLILDFIYTGLNIVSFRLMLAIAVNCFNHFDNEWISRSISDQNFEIKYAMLTDSYSQALKFLKQNISNGEDLKSEFMTTTFNLFIRRVEFLAEYFLHTFKATDMYSMRTFGVLWLRLLVKNQNDLTKIIKSNVNSLTSSVISYLIRVHYEFCFKIVHDQSMKPILVETYASESSKQIIFALCEITIELAKLEHTEADNDLRLKIVSLLPMSLCLFNKYDWIRETNLPGTNDLWDLVLQKWNDFGFQMVLVFCRKSLETKNFSHDQFEYLTSLIYKLLSYKLAKQSYVNLNELFSQYFFDSVVVIVANYDLHMEENDQCLESFTADVMPLLDAVLRVFQLTSCNLRMFVKLSDFYLKLFAEIKSKTLSPKSNATVWSRHFEFLLLQMNQFHNRNKLHGFDCVTKSKLMNRLVDLSCLLKEFYFETSFIKKTKASDEYNNKKFLIRNILLFLKQDLVYQNLIIENKRNVSLAFDFYLKLV